MRLSVSRIIGWTFVGLAAVATGAEFDRYQGLDPAAGAWSPVSSLSAWELFGGGTLDSFRAFSVEHLHPAVWDPGLVGVLSLPPAALLAGLGLFFLLIARLRAGQVIPEPRGALRAGMALAGAVFAVAGLGVFGADLAIDASGVTLEARSAAALWEEVHPESLALLQTEGRPSGDDTQQTAPPGGSAIPPTPPNDADAAAEAAPTPQSASALAAVLAWPAWQVLLAPGFLLVLLGSLGRRSARRRAIPIPSGTRARTREGERVLEKRAQFLDQMQERPRPPRREPRHPVPPAATPPVPATSTEPKASSSGSGHDGGSEGRDRERRSEADDDPQSLRLVKD